MHDETRKKGHPDFLRPWSGRIACGSLGNKGKKLQLLGEIREHKSERRIARVKVNETRIFQELDSHNE